MLLTVFGVVSVLIAIVMFFTKSPDTSAEEALVLNSDVHFGFLVEDLRLMQAQLQSTKSDHPMIPVIDAALINKGMVSEPQGRGIIAYADLVGLPLRGFSRENPQHGWIVKKGLDLTFKQPEEAFPS